MQKGDNNNCHGNQGNHQSLLWEFISNKFEILEEMDRFLDTYHHLKLNQEDMNHVNRSVTQNEIEAAIKSLPKKKSPEY
jgi:deoxyribodipyrimidine photolyase-like uncharacterized protein